jgi:hypothetical protein
MIRRKDKIADGSNSNPMEKYPAVPNQSAAKPLAD